MMRTVVIALLLAATSFGTALADTTGLPVPRFVSLRSDEVNLRTGPGVRYPVDWIYARKDLPVEIIGEHEHWRKIRDWEGIEGWVHQSMLSGRRMMMVTGGTRPLLAEAEPASRPVALVEAGVSGRLLQCPRNGFTCRVEIGTAEGWMRREHFWGVYPGEWLE